MRLEFVVVIGIVLLMHSIYVAGTIANSKEKTDLKTGLNGSIRAIIPIGRWESVLPMDILPDFLIKSILSEDIEQIEKLGIYE